MASTDEHKDEVAGIVANEIQTEIPKTANGAGEGIANSNGDEVKPANVEEVKPKVNVLEAKELPVETEKTSDKEELKKDVEKDGEKYDRHDHRKSEHYDRREHRGRGNRARGRGGRGGGRGNFRNNAKSAFEDQPESSDAEEIRRQVEFYFSDSNLPIDAYLLQLTGGHENKPVELKTIHNFKRMRHFQPYSAVRDAVKESKFLDLDDKDNITRKQPLSDRFTDDTAYNKTIVHSSSMGRSIYAKGFGEETKSTHLDIEAFFAPYGETRSVRLRRKDDGSFKGSVFVEFDNEETQKQFLELDPKPQWDGKDLQIMAKQEYVDLKHDGILDGTVKPGAPYKNYGGGRNRGGRDRRYSNERGYRRYSRDNDDDDIDKDDWNARRDRDNGRDRRSGGRGYSRGRGRGGKDARDRGGRDYRDRDGGRRRRSHSPESRSRSPEKRDRDGDRNDKDAAVTEKPTESEQIEQAASDGATAAGVESKKRARDDGEDGAENGEKQAKKAKEDEAA